MSEHANTTDVLVAARRDGRAFIITDAAGRVFRANTPRELWDDLSGLVEDGPVARPALGASAERRRAGPDVVEAEVVDEDEAPRQRNGRPREAQLDDERVEGAMQQIGSIFEEIAENEFGPVGRIAAGAAIRNGKRIAQAASPRERKKRAARRARGRK